MFSKLIPSSSPFLMHSPTIGTGHELPVEVLEIIIAHALLPPWTCMTDAIESNRKTQHRLHIRLVCKLWYRIAQYVDPCLCINSSDPSTMLATLPAKCKRVKLFVDTDHHGRGVQDGQALFQSSPLPPTSGLMGHWEMLAGALAQREGEQEMARKTQPRTLLASHGRQQEQQQHQDPSVGTIELCLTGNLLLDSRLPILLDQAHLGNRITLLSLHFSEYTELDIAYFFHGQLVFQNMFLAYPSNYYTSAVAWTPLPNLQHLHLYKVTLTRLPWRWTLCDEAQPLLTLSLDHVRTCDSVIVTLLRAVCGPHLRHLRLANLGCTLGPSSHQQFIPAMFAAIQDGAFDGLTTQGDASLISVELPGIHELDRDDLYMRMRAMFPRVRLIRLIHDDQLEIVLTFSSARLKEPPGSGNMETTVLPPSPLDQRKQPNCSYDPSVSSENLAEEIKSNELVLTSLEIQGPLKPDSFPARVINKFLCTPHARHLCLITGLSDR